MSEVGRLSVVTPAFNEESTIWMAIQRVLQHDFVREVVVVDDGSTDGTVREVSRIDDSRLRLVCHPTNSGKGAAIRTGIIKTNGPYVGILDADLEYDPADFRSLLSPLDDGRADAVYGSRFITGEARRALMFWHSMGNRLLTLLSNSFTNLNLSDMETCLKVFKSELIKSVVIEEDRFGFEPEVTAKIAISGARVYEVGISYSGRTY